MKKLLLLLLALAGLLPTQTHAEPLVPVGNGLTLIYNQAGALLTLTNLDGTIALASTGTNIVISAGSGTVTTISSTGNGVSLVNNSSGVLRSLTNTDGTVTIANQGTNVLLGTANLVPTSRTVSTTAPLAGGGALSGNLTLSMPAATGTQSGYLTSSDFVTFSNKVSQITSTGNGQSLVSSAAGVLKSLTNTDGKITFSATGTNISIDTTGLAATLTAVGNGASLINSSGGVLKTLTNDASGVAITDQTTNLVLKLSAVPNTSLANSSLTINGTANQISTTSAAVALGASATLSIPTDFRAPGTTSVATGITNNGYYISTPQTLAYVTGTNVLVDWSKGSVFNLLMTNTTWLILTNIQPGMSGYVVIQTNGTAQTLSYGAAATSHILTNSSITTITNQTRLSCATDYTGTNMHVQASAGFQ